tara:strand:+ start:5488 stop:5745 length:258 start_codon:yes stop_codon:yes gene_type:complete
MNLAKLLKKYCTEYFIANIDIARELSVSRSSVSLWLSGQRRPYIGLIKPLSRYLAKRMDKDEKKVIYEILNCIIEDFGAGIKKDV